MNDPRSRKALLSSVVRDDLSLLVMMTTTNNAPPPSAGPIKMLTAALLSARIFFSLSAFSGKPAPPSSSLHFLNSAI